MAVKFLTGTYAQYSAITPDSDSLYFLTDGHLYKGTQDMTNQVKVVATLPDTLAANTVYVVTSDKSVVFFDGTNSTTIVPAIVSAISDSTAGTSLADVTAIKNYVSSVLGNYSVTVSDGTAASGEKKVYDIHQGAAVDGVVPTVGSIKIPDLTIAEDTTDNTVFKKYKFTYGNSELSTTISIPKDFLVKSGDVKTVTTADTPVTGYAVGDKYIDFVINTKDGSGTDEHMYINVKELIDVYNGDADTFTTGVKVTVDNSTNKISAALVGKAVAETNLTDELAAKINNASPIWESIAESTGTEG